MDDINNLENSIADDANDKNISQENNESNSQVEVKNSQEEAVPSWNNEQPEETPTVEDHLKNFISKEQDLEAVFDVPVKVSAVLGSASMPVHQLLKLGRGAVIELDRRIGEAVDIYVNNLLVARGEVVMVEDRLGITMTEIIKGKK